MACPRITEQMTEQTADSFRSMRLLTRDKRQTRQCQQCSPCAQVHKLALVACISVNCVLGSCILVQQHRYSLEAALGNLLECPSNLVEG